MGWEYNEREAAATRENAPARRKRTSTGVKHYRPTISGFSHPEPDKAEALLTRINLRSSDPMSSGGGSGKGLTALEIAGALTGIRSRAVARYIGDQATARAAADLALYKYTGDQGSLRGIRSSGLVMLASIAVEQGWGDAKSDGRDRGQMQSCVAVCIEDICSPLQFVGVSARRWARMLGLSSHQDWIRKWDRRYSSLRYCLQELDCAIEATIQRKL